MPDTPRTYRFGDYTIAERLGEGGMCLVFRARKDGATADVALKLLRSELEQDPRIRDLFVTEADLSLLVDHPNLIRTCDAGEVEGRLYIAMDLVEGASLADLSERLANLGIVFPPDLAIFAVDQLLRGLGALHDAKSPSGKLLGLVHRDVTPHNVFVDFTGRVILGDLGITHISAHGRTEPGRAAGKIDYLAPEVVLGETPELQSDLYAVGIILFELLVGERPLSYPDDASDQLILEAIAQGKLKRPRKLRPSIPKDLEELLLDVLSRLPTQRPASALEVCSRLAPWLSPVLANPRILAGMLAGAFPERAVKFAQSQPPTHG
ncbi:MAG: serine/threonine protein kinase [Deltaproteobacteria bacterium]|nr:serine/threonine protein kinase [Deltaproteobacteria bacterium]